MRTARYLGSNGMRRRISRRRLYERLADEPVPLAAAAGDEFELVQEGVDAEKRAARIKAVLGELDDIQRRVLVMHALGCPAPRSRRRWR